MITVYYDGLCQLCSREITHYKKQTGQDQIHFIDITEDDFDATREGVDPKKVHQIMHVRDQNGALKTKVDAFITIWKTLPKYRFLAKWAEVFWIKFILTLGYHIFAFIRPYLPRKSKNCETSPYCDINKKVP